MQLRNLCVLAKPGTNRGFLVACDNSLTNHDKEKNQRRNIEKKLSTIETTIEI